MLIARSFQVPFFWLLVSLLAAIAGARVHWESSATERWLPDWLQSVDVQWRVVSTGLCMNLFGVLWLLAGGSGKPRETKRGQELQEAVLPKVAHFESQAPVVRKSSCQSAGSIPDAEDSFNWMNLCCWTPRSESSSVMRHNSYGGAPDLPMWLQDDSTLHPKFCGYRLKEPGSMPSLDRFLAEPLGSNVPPHWEFMLPACGDDERMKCRELRERVRHVRGSKDPITILRFLRARQGSVEAAAKMYETAMRWREGTGYELGFRLNNKDDWLHRRVDSCWPPTGLMGKDYDGDPVYWNRMGLGNLEFLEQAPSEFLVQHEVYTITRLMQAMEEASRLNNKPIMNFTVVADLGELSWRSFNIKGIMKYKVCVRTLEDNFPELVKRIIAIRVPRLAYTIWNIASHFFDEGTRAKIQIADGQHTMKVLSEVMDPKWIPEALGGTHRIGDSPWCEPIIPCPRGPPSAETMRALQAAYES